MSGRGTASQRLPPRLSKRADFLYVQGQGRRLRSRLVTLLYAPVRPLDGPHARLGYTVSRKVGHAVVRNRVRRRLREAVRGDGAPLVPGMMCVLIAHPQAACEAYASLRAEVTCLLAKMRSQQQVQPAHG